jgi:hypothetical protein
VWAPPVALPRRGRPLILAAALLAAACGYRGAAGRGLAGGVERAFVAPFENRSGDAEAGAFVSASVRDELERRDAGGGRGSRARIEGVVEETRASPSSPNGATWRLYLRVQARLVEGERALKETRLEREEEYLAGQDPLELEGRRRLALRRAAAALARDVVEAFEAP